MLFINTRPLHRAQALTHQLRNAGIDVLELPLISINPLTLSDQDKQLFANRLMDYDVLVVVSPTAAELGLQQLYSNEQLNNPSTKLLTNSSTKVLIKRIANKIHIVAVGHATAQVLLEQAILAEIPKTTNNEGMLALECMAKLTSNSRVLVWRGQGGRRLLIDELRSRGVMVDVIELYQRQLPKGTANDYINWLSQIKVESNTVKAGEQVNVLISSGDAFKHWQMVVASSDVKRLNDFSYVVLGQRLQQMLMQHGLKVKIINNLQPSHILDLITNPL